MQSRIQQTWTEIKGLYCPDITTPYTSMLTFELLSAIFLQLKNYIINVRIDETCHKFHTH